MKIFATRTKKKAAGPRTVNKSDPVVEELLKKDPSEWNAKERRMVKRYQKRKDTDTPETADETEKTKEIDDEAEAQEENVQQEKDGDEDNKSSSDDSDDSSSSSEDESDKEAEAEEEQAEEQANDSEGESSSDNNAEESTEAKAEQSTIEEKRDAPEDDGKVGKDHEIWSVLDKLNSKQKRTLTRKLERLGTEALEEVEQEANKILDETMPIEEAAPVVAKRELDEATTSEAPTKKKRKKQADWSSLTPEERLRREDQRRKQQEAAERKARGESAIKPGHKRPLNSARRRANRRKPKWEKKAPSERPDISNYKQEHHSSGFMVRKNRKQPQEAANW